MSSILILEKNWFIRFLSLTLVEKSNQHIMSWKVMTRDSVSESNDNLITTDSVHSVKESPD